MSYLKSRKKCIISFVERDDFLEQAEQFQKLLLDFELALFEAII
jgi:hypothetical protein